MLVFCLIAQALDEKGCITDMEHLLYLVLALMYFVPVQLFSYGALSRTSKKSFFCWLQAKITEQMRYKRRKSGFLKTLFIYTGPSSIRESRAVREAFFMLNVCRRNRQCLYSLNSGFYSCCLRTIIMWGLMDSACIPRQCPPQSLWQSWPCCCLPGTPRPYPRPLASQSSSWAAGRSSPPSPFP